MKEKARFNWKCPHCGHRNSASVTMQFEMPRYYSAEWKCDECGKLSKLEWNLTVRGWLDGKKTPKLRKRKQEEKKRRKEKTEEEEKEKENDGYTNHPGNYK